MGNCCHCCSKKTWGDTEFTVLLVQVLNVSHPLALEGSSVYARQLVEGFFRKYTQIDPSLVEPHANKFLRLTAESRLEIAFVGHPVGFQAPSYKIYKYEPAGALSVVFEVEVRIIRRFINPGYEYAALEIERTDYIPQYLSDYAYSRVACSENEYAVPRPRG
jgi:hypothetical protein